MTKNRKNYFGEIVGGRQQLNDLGKYATNHRKQISDHYPFVICDEFICMQNHIHGIIMIGKNQPIRDVGTQFFASSGLNKQNVLSNSNRRTYKNTSLPKLIGPKSGSLGSIVRGFKIGITKYAKQNNIPFQGQGRYHDRIIRDHDEYQRIKRYIKNNPKNRNGA